MFLVRLFLPVWPLTLALAAPYLTRSWRQLFAAAVIVSGLVFVGTRLHTIGYWALGERSHVPLARMMRAHAKPGDMVVFQDLGQTPWAAMDLRFVDPLGLVDSTIGKIRWRDRASPFLRMPSERGQEEIRDHLFAIHPQLIAFVAYVDDEYADEVRKQADAAKSAHEKETLFVAISRRAIRTTAACATTRASAPSSVSSTSSGAKTTTGSFCTSVLRFAVRRWSCSTKAISRPTLRARRTTGETVKLSELRGKRVLLWFYPMADTPG